MTIQRWIIDDFGELHVQGSERFYAVLGSGLAGAEPLAYAIENIGCIGLSLDDERICVRYRPAVVSERAIAGLYYWLADHRRYPVTIAWLTDVWTIERANSVQAAMSFISYSLDTPLRRNRWGGPRLLSRVARDVRQRWNDTAEVFDALVRCQHSRDEERGLFNRVFSGRWTILDVDDATGFMRAIEIGPGYPPLDPDWTGDARGRSFAEFPDREYAVWASNQYRQVAESDRPLIDDVDAIIHWPRLGDLRTRYWRLILPLTSSGGSCRLLSVSGNGSGIDLRPELVDEPAQIVG